MPNNGIHLIDFGIAANAGARRLTFGNFSRLDSARPTTSHRSTCAASAVTRAATSTLWASCSTRCSPARFPSPAPIPSPMNDRLLNYPAPPSKLDPSVTPQMQEILCRASSATPKTVCPRAGVSPRPGAPRRGGSSRPPKSLEVNAQRRESPPAYRNLLFATLIRNRLDGPRPAAPGRPPPLSFAGLPRSIAAQTCPRGPRTPDTRPRPSFTDVHATAVPLAIHAVPARSGSAAGCLA